MWIVWVRWEGTEKEKSGWTSQSPKIIFFKAFVGHNLVSISKIPPLPLVCVCYASPQDQNTSTIKSDPVKSLTCSLLIFAFFSFIQASPRLPKWILTFNGHPSHPSDNHKKQAHCLLYDLHPPHLSIISSYVQFSVWQGICFMASHSFPFFTSSCI